MEILIYKYINNIKQPKKNIHINNIKQKLYNYIENIQHIERIHFMKHILKNNTEYFFCNILSDIQSINIFGISLNDLYYYTYMNYITIYINNFEYNNCIFYVRIIYKNIINSCFMSLLFPNIFLKVCICGKYIKKI